MSEADTSRSDFAAFYRATLAPLRRYLWRMVGCNAEAQDLAQDAYVRVYPAINNQQVAHPESFLFVTARRLALNKLRRQRYEPVNGRDESIETVASEAPSVQQVVMARQEWTELERALADLPAGCRTVLLLRKMEHLSHEEIAQQLGISRSTVEKQLARALRLLREAMQTPPVSHPQQAVLPQEKIPAIAECKS